MIKSSRRRPALRLLCVALAAAFIAPSVSAETIQASGLRAPGSIGYDAEGVPLIQAANDYDAAFLMGYVHARDRLWQMDYLRRAASGTLAELVGAPALANDIQLRTLGLRRAAQSSWSVTPDIARGELRAYAEGVNLWVRTHALPSEYTALELSHFEPWSPVDSLIVGKLLAFQLSFDLDIDYTVRLGAYMSAGAAAGFNGQALFFEDTHRVQPFDTRASIAASDFHPTAVADEGKSLANGIPTYAPEFLAQTEALRDALLTNEWIAPKLAPRENRGGSNWWIVHGSKTASGKAILSNDPHLGLDLPAVMHEAHIVSTDPAYAESMNVSGLAPPGVPSILLGCKPQFCWGLTTNPMDVSDTYQEKFLLNTYGLPTHTLYKGVAEPVNWTFQSYYVNKLDGVMDNAARDNSVGYTNGGLTITIPRRNQGPVLSITNDTGISVAYTGWGPTRELEAIRRINRANNLDEFRSALTYFDVGSQNFGYAGTDGTIAYFTTAEAPVREDLQANSVDGVPPFLIRDGSGAKKNEWLPVTHPQVNQSVPYEILPPSEMPYVINPGSGYIANANNDPLGNTFDNNAFNQMRPGGGLYYLSFGYSSLRVGRIDRALQSLIAAGPVSATQMKSLQANTQLLDAELVLPYVSVAFDHAESSTWPELHALAQDAGIVEAVGRLRAWDYSSPTGLSAGFDAGDNPAAMTDPGDTEVANSVAATIWALWRGQAVRNTVDATMSRVGLANYLPGSNESYVTLKRLLERYDTQQGKGISGLNFFQVTGAPNADAARDYILLKSLADALTLAASDGFAPAFAHSTNQNDYRWGRLHRIVFDHALGGPFNIPGPGLYGLTNLGPGLDGLARQGGYEAVDASSHNTRANTLNGFMFGSGPARRFVGEMSTPIVADQIYPGGQNAVLGSPGYISQLPRWLVNAYKPLPIDQAAHQAAVVSTINFVPAGNP
ncbi:MAG TPA: penicillin acylase family protein [Pseudomonadota bacterium]|nr:penicillin acylase family protein [Rhodanobacteraceae bacterium]HQW80950.1 penicillin acylase family protein [Pseudomonadota bacterium]